MFCKSGVLIVIFAKNNYSIYAHTMMIKTPLLHQSSGPHVFLSFSPSLYFWLISWNASCVTQEILASLLLSLFHLRLWTTRFWSIKGPQQDSAYVSTGYMHKSEIDESCGSPIFNFSEDIQCLFT